jgi:enoyl-CoA hydratase/carnithine racemase
MISYIQVHHETRERGSVAQVAIDNTSKLNSLSSEVMAQFVAAFADLAREADLRAVVLTGAGGKAFVGGANVDEMAALGGPTEARAFIERVHGCCQAVRDLPVPVIARIDGYCLGAGLELAAACDLRLTSDTSVFGMPEVKLGLPSVVEAALLPALIGWGRTRRILYTGETFGAVQALAWGLVEEVHPAAGLDGAVDALVNALLEAEPRAVQLQKALVQRWEGLPMAAAIQAGVDAFEDAWTTEEPASALARFQAERRAAKATRGA